MTTAAVPIFPAGSGEPMIKNKIAGAGKANPRHHHGRQGDSMIKIEVTTALKDALDHATTSGTPQVALYKDKPVVILSYDEYERTYQPSEDGSN
jgi:hypothetical protein